MLRQSLRRCLQLRCTAVAAPGLAAQQPVLSQTIARGSRISSIALRATYQPSSISSRWYSSEASAASPEAVATDSDSQLPTRFQDLGALGVHENLIRVITGKMGYETMTDVQSKTIAPALDGMDLVAQAKTGTGKTLGFLVPVLQRMLQEDPSLASRSARREARSDDIRGIVLSPTRELAEQIATEAQKLVANTGLVVQLAVGGTQKREMLHKTNREGCHLLVATPGRLNDLLSDQHAHISAPNLAAIVLDEADRMLDVGFQNELEDIMSSLPDPREKTRQTLLFSATIPRNVIELARDWVRPDNFDFIQTVSQGETLTHERVKQHLVPCRSWGNVFPALFELLEREHQKHRSSSDLSPFKAIVFLPSLGLVDAAADVYSQGFQSNLRCRGLRIHSKLNQSQRTRAADRFRQMDSGILFSSDVTARGMDFPNVTHVIQVGCPPDRQQYIHRLGRTGRQNKDGEGWLIISQSELDLARSQLGGLPIQPNREIASAEEDYTSGDQRSQALDTTMDALKSVPRETLRMAYMSLFSRVNSKTAGIRASEMREWFVDGVGLRNTPAVGPGWMSRLGMRDSRDLNVGRNNDFEEGAPEVASPFGDRGGFGRRGPGGGGSFGSSSGGSFNRRDSFERGRGRGGDRRSDRGGSRDSFGRASF